ncbi:putative NTF2-like domain-containing protein YchJ [Candidatus Nitrotoga sp. BS]|uniref:YchJ family protein n=1 Tax=Candidatus Nitrotoga sp. BS TaxID=2890408 RepID=UPI001EF18F08|nr:YchJ family metal-binding protein [Candidatus Nitrotoga sp. BS]CAH1198206.1 putative NTF2-like domain-containing protein YchJ [Candidatus Nitrotoga sp. BS]
MQTDCACGSNKNFTDCCGCYIEGNTPAPSAEALMRSRYVAYTLGREDYLLATWHPSTRPATLDMVDKIETKWLGLEVKRHEYTLQEPDRAVVEFVARYKVGGRAHRLHEVSRFVCEGEQWFYVDGDIR